MNAVREGVFVFNEALVILLAKCHSSIMPTITLTTLGLFGTWARRFRPDLVSLQLEFAHHFSDADAQTFFLVNKNVNVYAIRRNEVTVEAGQFEVLPNPPAKLILYVSFRNGAAVGGEQGHFLLSEGHVPANLHIVRSDSGPANNSILSDGPDFEKIEP